MSEVKIGAYGTEQLEDVQDLVIQGIKTGKLVAADKKFNLLDVASLLPMARPLQEAAEGVADTDDELLDLYDEEIDNLLSSFDQKAADVLTPQQASVGRRVVKLIYNAGALVREVRQGATV